MLALVAKISEQVGRLAAQEQAALTPQLRRGNRIRTIHAPLAIKNNSLSVEQVTAVLEDKRVLGLPRVIQEVRNAFAAYDAMPGWQPHSQSDLLEAHELLMQGLIDDEWSSLQERRAARRWNTRPSGWQVSHIQPLVSLKPNS